MFEYDVRVSERRDYSFVVRASDHREAAKVARTLFLEMSSEEQDSHEVGAFERDFSVIPMTRSVEETHDFTDDDLEYGDSELP